MTPRTLPLRFVEEVPVAARLRLSLVAQLRRLYHLRGRTAFRRRLKNLSASGAVDSILPNFGWLEEPERPEETKIGGAVKLDHLREVFGETRDGFSVLYLVSSILHLIPFPDELVAWAKARRIPVVLNQNGVAYPSWCGNSYPWFNAPMLQLIHQADYVIYQSAFCQRSAERYLGKSAVPHEILWNPVDLKHFSPSEQTRAEEKHDGPCRLLAMGTNHAFYRVKSSLDCLVTLIARGFPAHLTISGELRWHGADREVADYLDKNGIADAVTLRSRFSQTEAPDIYRSADVLLHPKYKDPCPTVPIEAMACGLPVVGSRSGGMPELVPPTAGLLVNVVDDWTADHEPAADAMADAVQSIMAKYADFTRGARAHAEGNFNKLRWAARHGEIFSELLNRGQRRRS